MPNNRRQNISIVAGNIVQIIGLGAGLALFVSNVQSHASITSSLGLILAYCMVGLTSFALAQYVLGRLMGVKFTHYSVGPSDRAELCAPIVKNILECVFVMNAHPDSRSLAQVSWFAKTITLNAGKLAFMLLSAITIIISFAANMVAGPILMVASALWLAHNVMVSFSHRRMSMRVVSPVMASRQRF